MLDPGQRFGSWEVISPSREKPYYYDCRCLKCGEIHAVTKSNLVRRKSSMCIKCANRNRPRKIHEEIIGKKFGRLTVTGWTTRRNSAGKNQTIYICECECGNATTATYDHLVVRRKKQSCGCLKSEISKKTIRKTYKKIREEQAKASIDGTIAFTLDAKVSKNSKTGVKGVSKLKNGRFRAYINLARKQRHLGTFDSLEEAAAARKEAEEKYFKPILAKYKEK